MVFHGFSTFFPTLKDANQRGLLIERSPPAVSCASAPESRRSGCPDVSEMARGTSSY